MEGKESHDHCNHHHHPLLTRARKEGYSHGFSPSQIQALAAACEAFLPSLPTNNNAINNEGGDSHLPAQLDEDVLQYYYKASCSQSPLPDEVS